MAAFYHALGFLKYDAGNLDMAVCRFVKCGGNNLSIDGTSHICHLLWTLIDEQHHDIGFGVVGGDGIGNVFHQDRFTCLRLSHDECALTFTDRREEVDDANAGIRCLLVAAKIELLFWE